MKYTTTTILAGLAAGAAAESWASWQSTTANPITTGSAYCPKDVTETKIVTEDCAETTVEVWQTTVTLEAPEVKTVTVYPNGQSPQPKWAEWKPTTTPTYEPKPSVIPPGCSPSVHTVYTTQSVKKVGSVTTKTGSTLFIGVGQAAKSTVTVTASGNDAAPTGGYGSGSNSDSGSGSGSDSGNTHYKGAYGDAPKPDDDDDYNGAQPEKWATTTNEKLVATGASAFKWTIEPTGITKTFLHVPEYTLLPGGNYGFDWKDFAEWAEDVVDELVDGASDIIGGAGGDLTEGLGDIGGDIVDGIIGGSGNSGQGSGKGYSNSTTTAKASATSTGKPKSTGKPFNNAANSTANAGNGPAAGSAGSNVTAPFEALAENDCNSASSRSTWCNGKSVQSDIDEEYHTGVTRRFELTLTNGTQNLDGEEVMSLLVNGQRPGPAIEVNWGDMVEVTVHNQMQNNGTSIHWHGLRQIGTNDQDGVPGVTECPLAPGESRVYRWHASSYGTGWYHSHWMTQSGDGVHGPLIIHGPATANYDIDAGVVQLEDTFPKTAAQWNYITSKVGPVGTQNYLLNGHNTKADLSGGQHALWTVQPGKKYLFRFINSASQNMFSVSLDGHKMSVIAADFIPIQPYETEWLNIGIGQRYDVIIEMDQAVNSYFLRAVTQMGCPSSCDNTGLGQANGIIAYEGVQTSPYLLPTTSTNRKIEDFKSLCDDEPLASLVPAVQKSAGSAEKFSASVETIPAGAVNTIQTADDGAVTRWYLNNGWADIDFDNPTLQTLAKGGNTSSINNNVVLKKSNEWYYFVIQNQFFAGHPMHLHGHDFSILGQGEGVFDKSQVGALNFVNPMRRDTGMLKGVESDAVHKQGWTVIAFKTDNPGAWLMHCHIVWHVDQGLSLQWIERPDDIDATKYVDSDFQSQCKAYTQYEAQDPAHKKTSGSSGLRRRGFFDEQLELIEAQPHLDVVRRSGRSERRYLADKRARRGIGESRHFRK